MKIAVIGATGNAGSRIVAELLDRGHSVTGIARHPEKFPARSGLTMQKGDVHDTDHLASLLVGHDAVISAVHFLDADARDLIDAIKKARVARYFVVGGAGSLEDESGRQLVDSPDFPAAYFKEASKGRDFLNTLRQEKDLSWTFLSPAMIFTPGKRTGQFRLGKDRVLVSAEGKSFISMEDYAIAVADEMENPEHVQMRYTIGY